MAWWAGAAIGLGVMLLVFGALTIPRQRTVPGPVALESSPAPDLPEVGAAATAVPRPRVAVDAGHGGTDVGGQHCNALGAIDLTESQVNLQVAFLLRDALQARGCDVYLTRSGDDFPGEPLQDWNGDGEVTLRDDLQLRTDRVNAQGADLLISLHENALDDVDPLASCYSGGGGTTTYYCADRPFADRNLRLATLVHQEVLAAIRSFGYEPADQGVIDDHLLQTPTGKGEHLYILGPHDNVITRPSLMPGVLSEALFLSCEHEAALLARADFRAALAEAYADAIAAYFEGEGRPLVPCATATATRQEPAP